jgi:hypothetical protein
MIFSCKTSNLIAPVSSTTATLEDGVGEGLVLIDAEAPGPEHAANKTSEQSDNQILRFINALPSYVPATL